MRRLLMLLSLPLLLTSCAQWGLAGPGRNYNGGYSCEDGPGKTEADRKAQAYSCHRDQAERTSSGQQEGHDRVMNRQEAP